jgi:hypothetical protein
MMNDVPDRIAIGSDPVVRHSLFSKPARTLVRTPYGRLMNFQKSQASCRTHAIAMFADRTSSPLMELKPCLPPGDTASSDLSPAADCNAWSSASAPSSRAWQFRYGMARRFNCFCRLPKSRKRVRETKNLTHGSVEPPALLAVDGSGRCSYRRKSKPSGFETGRSLVGYLPELFARCTVQRLNGKPLQDRHEIARKR